MSESSAAGCFESTCYEDGFAVTYAEAACELILHDLVAQAATTATST